MRRALILLIGACTGGTPARPPSNTALRAADTPAPTIAWNTDLHGFFDERLPAVAHDGSVVAIHTYDSDGGRGYPNLRLELRDRDDHIVEKRQVLVSNEWEDLAATGEPDAELQHRVADANALLATWNARYALVAMHALDRPRPPEGDPTEATGDGLDVIWTHHQLVVSGHGAGDPMQVVDGTPWLAKPRAGCDNPAYLANAYHAKSANVVVVGIAFHGTDLCWEPSTQWHVVAW